MKVTNVANEFDIKGTVQTTLPYGDGHINDTYKVTCLSDEKNIHYILQGINNSVFKDVEGLMKNIEGVTTYLSDSIKRNSINAKCLRLVKTKTGKSYYKDETNKYYRIYEFIENSTGYLFADTLDKLYEAGKAFGEFSKLLADYPVETLGETIEDFHNTPVRYEAFLKAVEADAFDRKKDCLEEIKFVEDRKSITSVITSNIESKNIPLRVTHNDTKINNVLIDDATGRYAAVIDLDTVMPGTLLCDYGDAIRSCGSTAVEDEENLDKVKLDLDRIKAYTNGYLKMLGSSITKEEYELLPTSAVLMTFECGIRFLTDYLNGDVYFKVHRDKHNLIRARNQFKFVKELEDNMDEYKKILKERGEAK